MIPGWVDVVEEEVRSSLQARGAFSARELADALGVTEASAVQYIALLASSGRLTIEAVSLARAATRGADPATRIPAAA